MVVETTNGRHLKLYENYLDDQEVKAIAAYIDGLLDFDPNVQIFIRPYVVDVLKREGLLERIALPRGDHYGYTSGEQSYFFTIDKKEIHLVMNSNDFYQITYYKNNRIEYIHYERSTDAVVYLWESAKF